MKPPVTYSHPKSVIVMIHMTGGTEMPFRSDGSSYAEATSEARSGVEKRAGFRFLVHLFNPYGQAGERASVRIRILKLSVYGSVKVLIR